MTSEPLTFEQLFGVPESDIKKPVVDEDFCPYQQKKCCYWDAGCQVDGACHMAFAGDKE